MRSHSPYEMTFVPERTVYDRYVVVRLNGVEYIMSLAELDIYRQVGLNQEKLTEPMDREEAIALCKMMRIST